jgi:hypothetical protein
VTLPDEVTQIAAGAWFSLAVTSTGRLYAFGENRFGQLGNTTNNLTTEPNPTPTLVTLPGASGPVTQVVAGTGHSLALTSTGQLYAFGENYCGQLGNATNDRTQNPNPSPTLVTLPGATGRIIRIAAGNAYSLALTSTGELYAFGCDAFGELGTPPGKEKLAPHPTPALVALPGGANVETMATGCWANHTLVVIADLAVENASLPAGEIGFPYSAQAQGTGGAAPYRWAASGLPPGLSIDSPSGAITGTPTSPRSYTTTITITDGYEIEASKSLTITIKGPDEPPPSSETPSPRSPNETPQPSAPTGTPRPTTPEEIPPRLPLSPPSVQNARQSTKQWREGDKLARISRGKTPIGTTFSFSLNERASVTFSFSQLLGRHQGAHKCAARTASKVRNSCEYRFKTATLSFTGHSGKNNAVFTGRISRTNKLKPGRYELIITATSSDGQRSAPVSLRFTILT